MKLRCTSRYRATYENSEGNQALDYQPGDEIADGPLATWLLKDAPGSFEVVSYVAVRALSEPPAHRMMTGADSETRTINSADSFTFDVEPSVDELPAAAPVVAKPVPTKPRPRSRAKAKPS